MNDKEFGAKLKPWLDRSAAAVGEMQATRLRAARLRALDRFQEPVRVLGLVTMSAGTLQTIQYSIVQRALLWLPIAALLATLAFQSLHAVGSPRGVRGKNQLGVGYDLLRISA